MATNDPSFSHRVERFHKAQRRNDFDFEAEFNKLQDSVQTERADTPHQHTLHTTHNHTRPPTPNPPVEFQAIGPVHAPVTWNDNPEADNIRTGPITTLRWRPELHSFEVIGQHRTLMVPQQRIVDFVLGIERDDKILRQKTLEAEDLATRLIQLKEDVLSLVECCEDETCEKDHLCDQCIMIKGWAS